MPATPRTSICPLIASRLPIPPRSLRLDTTHGFYLTDRPTYLLGSRRSKENLCYHR